MRTATLTVAAAQPVCRPLDVAANAATHAEVVRAAGARVVVLPELSLTGYELAAPPVDPADERLNPLVEACGASGTTALVGAPIETAGRAFIAVLAVDGGGVRVAYRKTWLGAAEAGRFSTGDGPTAIVVDGWRLGLGVCKDTGTAQHVAGVAALGVDAYCAGVVHTPDELPEQEARAVVIARACRAFVVLASHAGPTGEAYDATAGGSAIFSPEGLALTRTDAEPGRVVRATLRPGAVERV